MTTESDSQVMRTPRQTGSAAVLASMDNCTKCGICQTHCPVAAATPLFPGPKVVGPQMERFRVIDDFAEHSSLLCSGCGICTSVCPNDVQITDIIAIAKADAVKNGKDSNFGQRLLNRPDVVGKVGGMIAPVANVILANRFTRGLAEAMFGISARAALPRFRGRAFRRWLTKHVQPDGPTVGYFSGCAVEYYEPQVGIAVVRLMNHLGYRVEAPSDACCGLPMLSSGEWRSARGRARHLVDALALVATTAGAIVASSTSCGLTLRKKYAAYLDMQSAADSKVADAMIDICSFLRKEAPHLLHTKLRPMRTKVLYHGPCQLRSHQVGLPAAELLRGIDGLKIEMSRASCCGTAGTYGYHRDKRDIAEAVSVPLIEQIRESRPDFVICDSETCRWHIAAESRVPAFHPVEVLLASIDGHNLVSRT